VFSDVAKEDKTHLSENPASAQASATETVLSCIAATLRESVGLKIAGVVKGEGELPYIFAVPEKSGALLVICIKELNIADNPSGIRLTLALKAFGGKGENIYERSITGASGAGPPQNNQPEIEKALLFVTKDILRQYADDPALRPLIMKYKLGSLLKFI
jgi:hypothetical protein